MYSVALGITAVTFMLIADIMLSGCTPGSVQDQLDTTCTSIRAAHSVLAGSPQPKRVQEAFDVADVICASPPKDIPSAVGALAGAYLVISQYQAKVK